MKRRKAISLAINAAVVVFEAIAACMSVHDYGVGMFEFYTIDSNLLALAACLLMTVYLAMSLKGDGPGVPGWVLTLKYAAACCLTLTFLVVVFVLIPTFGPQGARGMLLEGPMPFHHVICPLLVFASFVFFEADGSLGRRQALLSVIPTVIYAGILVPLNIARVVEGPYPFLRVYEQPVFISVLWCIAIIGGSYLMAVAIRKLSVRIAAKREIRNQAVRAMGAKDRGGE